MRVCAPGGPPVVPVPREAFDLAVSSILVTIGISSGGVEALSGLVAGLPADLPAAVFVVLHLPEEAPSVLPRILSRAGE